MVQHTYINGKRYHQTALGALPGVTTVLSATKDERSQRAIAAWKKRVGEEEAERIMNAACERGTKLHNTIESYLKSPVTPLNLDSGTNSLFSLVKPLLDDLDEVKYIEIDSYHPLGYGGSADLIAVYKGHLTVFDWKTSTKPKKRSYIGDYILQIAAYIASCNYKLGTDINRGVVAVVTPGADEYQLFKITPKQYEKAWGEFKERLLLFQSLYPNDDF